MTDFTNYGLNTVADNTNDPKHNCKTNTDVKQFAGHQSQYLGSHKNGFCKIETVNVMFSFNNDKVVETLPTQIINRI